MRLMCENVLSSAVIKGLDHIKGRQNTVNGRFFYLVKVSNVHFVPSGSPYRRNGGNTGL